ncbi:MAG TPA: NAD(P)-binding domain-containing protein, partial [Chitinophaga sp.]
MDIVIIGAGNIAWCYGQQLRLNGHVVQQVISRQEAHAQALGEMLNAAYTTDLLSINMEADVYLLAVSDDALAGLNDELRLGRRMVAHTAGAVPLSAIGRISTHTGVVYPLQSIRKENKSYPEIPIIIEASNDETLRRLQSLAQSISPRITVADSA